MPVKKGKSCWGDVMGEFKRGQLNSGKSDGPVVKSRQQAKAIAASICDNKEMDKRKQDLMSLGYSEEAVIRLLRAHHPEDFSENDTAKMVISRLEVIEGRCAETIRVIKAAMAAGAEIDMEQWAVDKITLAADYISAAADNLKYGDAMELEMEMPYKEKKKGLWDNIHAKRERIKRGSGERMRKPGEKGAPSAADLKAAQGDD